jgi:hypothetical protein
MCRVYSWEGGPAIRIILDITRLVAEGKLTAQEAERLKTLARRAVRCRHSVVMGFDLDQ